MKCKIFKYELPLVPGEFEIEMPKTNKALSVGTQDGVPYVWCKVYTKSKLIPKKFLLVFTGKEFEYSTTTKFVGTYTLEPLVYHLYQYE